jgi:hypothetical protein
MYNGGNWTWMSGSSSTNQSGSYGDKGVASPSNVPGARLGAIGWRDYKGNYWLFSGNGFNESSLGIANHNEILPTYVSGILNDVWKFESDILTFPGKLISFLLCVSRQ